MYRIRFHGRGGQGGDQQQGEDGGQGARCERCRVMRDHEVLRVVESKPAHILTAAPSRASHHNSSSIGRWANSQSSRRWKAESAGWAVSTSSPDTQMTSPASSKRRPRMGSAGSL